MKAVFKWIYEVFLIIVGTAVYTFGVYFFTEPYGIAPGGVVGIATALNSLFGVSIGFTTLLINIPLIISGTVFLGKNFIIKTFISLLTFTALMEFGYSYFPTYSGEKILSSIFGGALMGAGLSVNYYLDGSTGGMDIVNRIILKFFPEVHLGKIVLATDTFIILFAVLVSKNIDIFLYSALAIFISSKVVDKVLYGLAKRKMLILITEKPKVITKALLSLNRGVTVIKAQGGFSGDEKSVIMCVTARHEYFRFFKAIKQADENAFIIIADAGEVHGQGFLS